jgi:hypothetical protein
MENWNIMKRYYPALWLTLSEIVYRDIVAYLTYEGAGKHDPIDLVSRLHDRLKDVHSQRALLLIASLPLSFYVASYVLDIQIKLSTFGIEMSYDPIVLAIVIAVNSFMGYKTALYIIHCNILSTAIRAIIDKSVDPQIAQILKSAFLYVEDHYYYMSTSNPRLYLTNIFSVPLMMAYVLPAITSFILVTSALIINFLAIKIVYVSSHELVSIANFLLAVALVFSLSSFVLVFTTIIKRRYRDYSTLDKLSILDQFKPDEGDKVRENIYGRQNKLNRIANRL